ncbi:MAG: ribosome silencing factor [Planctomycetota bacterium]
MPHRKTKRPAPHADAGRSLAVEAARIAEHDNAEDIIVLDLRGISPVADYFVIATGTSDRQMRSIADDLTRFGKTTRQKVWHVAGLERGQWILLDFVDVVVHLFDSERRSYYDLELIWGGCPRVDWKAAPA